MTLKAISAVVRGLMLAAVAVFALALCACEETTEDKLENAGEATGEGIEKAADAVEDTGKGLKKGFNKIGDAFKK